jgi:hypothetical protein
MNQLSRLLYLSSGSDRLNSNQLRLILEKSRKNNAENNITGVLCAGGGHFIQILEGGENDLIRLYSKILDDPLHHDCALIGILPINERLFNRWSMGYIEKSLDAMELRRSELLSFRSQQQQGDLLIRVMQRFLELLKYQV